MSSNWTTINETYKNIDGYKRVAWPPVAEDKIIREFTPQPQLQNSQPLEQHQQPLTGAVSNQSVHLNHSESVDYHHHYNRSTSRFNHHQEENNYHISKLEWKPQINQPSFQAAAGTIPHYTQDHRNKEGPQEYTDLYLNHSQSHNTSKFVNKTPDTPSYIFMDDNIFNHRPIPSQRWATVQAPASEAVEPQCEAQGSKSSIPTYCGYNQHQNQAYRAPPPSAPVSQPNDRYQQHQQPQSFGSNSFDPHYNQQQQSQQTFVDGQHLQQGGFSKTSSQQLQQQHQQKQQNPLQQYMQQPLSPQAHQIYQQYPENEYNNCYSQPQQQQQLQQGVHPQQHRGTSPGIITLRKETPITQQPAPVYTSQPAAASYGGGSKMRGDLKWPPPEYKEQAAVENEEKRRIALGPVCRPRRIHRDYTQFFAKNALNSYYPSYKVPPGTQHMIN